MARIVVIDDEDLILEALTTILTQSGHQVRTANNGKAGLAAIRAERPDVVITDIIMPEMEGIETIRGIRALVPDMPIVAMSGGGRIAAVDLLAMASELGARVVLAKPFGREQLLAAIEACLAPRQ